MPPFVDTETEFLAVVALKGAVRVFLAEKPHGIAASKQPAAHIFKAQGIDDLIELVAKIIGTEALDVILP